jgi:hypothetical protein
MDEELERLINTLLDDVNCFSCGKEFSARAHNLEQQSAEVYTGWYKCPGDGCGTEFDLQVDDLEFGLSFEANERGVDRPDDLPDISVFSRKEPLQKESHPVRKLIDATQALQNALSILSYNQGQLEGAQEIVEENEGMSRSQAFHRRIGADIHNYAAAAYSFEEIFKKNVEPHIPSDSRVKDANGEFRDRNEVIKAMRTYAQHHLALPSAVSHFLGPNGDDDITITVPIDDLSDYQIRDPAASFDPVEGDHIRVVDRVNQHHEAAVNLVGAVLEVGKEMHDERIDEYREVTRFPSSEEL